MAYNDVYIMAIIHDAKDKFYSNAKGFLGAELEQLLNSDDKKMSFIICVKNLRIFH